MIITLKDGSEKEYASPMSVIDIASDISEGLARAACAGEINGKAVDLRTVVDGDCQLNILTANDKQGVQVVRHTASHVLAEAVKRLYPDAKLAIGPSIDTGFYYDFEHAPFSREDLDQLEADFIVILLFFVGAVSGGYNVYRFSRRVFARESEQSAYLHKGRKAKETNEK